MTWPCMLCFVFIFCSQILHIASMPILKYSHFHLANSIWPLSSQLFSYFIIYWLKEVKYLSLMLLCPHRFIRHRHCWSSNSSVPFWADLSHGILNTFSGTCCQFIRVGTWDKSSLLSLPLSRLVARLQVLPLGS